jgi:hypothetical protein
MQFWSRVAGSWLGQPVSSSPFSVEGIDWDLLRFVTGSG